MPNLACLDIESPIKGTYTEIFHYKRAVLAALSEIMQIHTGILFMKLLLFIFQRVSLPRERFSFTNVGWL